MNLIPIWYSDSLGRMDKDKNLAQCLQHSLLALIYHIFLRNYYIPVGYQLTRQKEGHTYMAHYRVV